MVKYRVNLIRQGDEPTRPYFIIDSNRLQLLSLYDTGAYVSVWTNSEYELMQYFPNSIIRQECFASISGFGGLGSGRCKVYTIPEVKIENEPTLINLDVVVSPNNGINTPLILSSGILWNANPHIISADNVLELTPVREYLVCKSDTVNHELLMTHAYCQEDTNTDYPEDFLKYCESVGESVESMFKRVIDSAPAVFQIDEDEMKVFKDTWEIYKKFL